MLKEEKTLTMVEISARLGVDRQVISREIKSGLPCLKIGGQYRFYWSEVEEYLRKNPTKNK